jgi:hypothetical protein
MKIRRWWLVQCYTRRDGGVLRVERFPFKWMARAMGPSDPDRKERAAIYHWTQAPKEAQVWVERMRKPMRVYGPGE